MINLIRRLASRLSVPASRDERSHRPHHGPFVHMLECDLANLDHITRSLKGPRG